MVDSFCYKLPVLWQGMCYRMVAFTLYHHCLLSSNLDTILLGRKECDIMYVYILDNFNFNFNFNSNSKCSHIYKFKYQSMFDHYADHHLFDHCADYHMSKSYVVILMHNTVVYIYLHSYKINILICNSKICWISKEIFMHNSDTIISHCICHSTVKLLYIGKRKKGD